jgi:hypothetical protein
MSSPNKITSQEICSMLERAGIEYLLDEDGDTYVTGLRFNFWISVNPDVKRITLRTYWNLCQPISELDALRCANHCNASYISLQFTIRGAGERMTAEQVITEDNALNEDGLLSTIRAFPIIFCASLQDPENTSIFEPSDESLDEADWDYTPPQRRLLN